MRIPHLLSVRWVSIVTSSPYQARSRRLQRKTQADKTTTATTELLVFEGKETLLVIIDICCGVDIY
jgi:hypothetical protein